MCKVYKVKVVVMATLLLALATSVVFAQQHDGVATGPGNQGHTEVSGPPPGQMAGDMPAEEAVPGTGSGGQEVTPRDQTREGHDEAARLVLARGCQIPKASAHPATPQVWHGTVAGRQRTEVYVRERGRTRTVYAGPRLTATKVNNLIAEWARKAGVASQSFVRKHVESKVAPLRRDLSDLRYDVTGIQGDVTGLQTRVDNLETESRKARSAPITPPTTAAPPPSAEGSLRQLWRENPWLVVAAVCLTLALGGIAAIINRLNRGGNP